MVGSRLIVEVEDAVWQRQLGTLERQILEKLDAVVGRLTISAIEFRIAVPRRPPRRAEKPEAAKDEADGIQDPVLRIIYREKRKKESA